MSAFRKSIVFYLKFRTLFVPTLCMQPVYPFAKHLTHVFRQSITNRFAPNWVLHHIYLYTSLHVLCIISMTRTTQKKRLTSPFAFSSFAHNIVDQRMCLQTTFWCFLADFYFVMFDHSATSWVCTFVLVMCTHMHYADSKCEVKKGWALALGALVVLKLRRWI